MTITKQDIQALTPEHRIVWHSPPGEPVEMGLYVDVLGDLRTDAGHLVRFKDGTMTTDAVGPIARIARIIPPVFVPRVGMVIGRPGYPRRQLHHMDDTVTPWLGYAPEIDGVAHWFLDTEARDLIENHGWEVMGDLPAQGEVTDAEVEAAARVLADYFGAGSGGWSVWTSKARTALEAAREARND